MHVILFSLLKLYRIPTKAKDNVEWLPTKANQMVYMRIDEELTLVKDEYPFKNRISNWDPIFGKNV